MTLNDLLERETAHHVIGAFNEVYNTLGFGFLEHIYRDALALELTGRGRSVPKEASVRIWYKGVLLSKQRTDLVVDERVVVELKATQMLPLVSEHQLRNYLQATSFEVGLLLHFGPEPRFFRLVHTNKPEALRLGSRNPP